MVRMVGGRGWSLRNMEIWGAESYAGLLVAGDEDPPSDWSITGSCVHDTRRSNGTNQDHNIYVNTGLGAGSGRIERNIIFGAPNGENIKIGGSDSSSSEGSANVVVRYNTLYDASQPVLIAGGTANTTVERNLIGNGGSGYLIRGYDAVGPGNRVVRNFGFGADEFVRDPGSIALADNVMGEVVSFDRVSCGGFHPESGGEAASFGRYAP